MKPIISKTETVELNGNEYKIIGEVFEEHDKRKAITEFGPIFSHINIRDWRGAQVHPGFSYPKKLTEDELQFELDFHKRNIKEKPQAYGL